jgi:hypothetical protein
MMSTEQKLDEALKETFPASDPFWLEPEQKEERPEGSEKPAAPPS